MPLTLRDTNWNDLTVVAVPGRSTNPVFQLLDSSNTDNGSLWLKFVPSGPRVAFADQVMARTGLNVPGSRHLPKDEARAVLQRIKTLAQGQPNNDNILFCVGNAEKALDRFDALVMTHAQGRNLKALIGEKPTQADSEQYFLTLLANTDLRRDIARMIAADLLLGNFDRLGAQPKGVQFHTDNFRLDPNVMHFIPIDNDTLAPNHAPTG